MPVVPGAHVPDETSDAALHHMVVAHAQRCKQSIGPPTAISDGPRQPSVVCQVDEHWQMLMPCSTITGQVSKAAYRPVITARHDESQRRVDSDTVDQIRVGLNRANLLAHTHVKHSHTAICCP
jgi:hypothetical protein